LKKELLGGGWEITTGAMLLAVFFDFFAAGRGWGLTNAFSVSPFWEKKEFELLVVVLFLGSISSSGSSSSSGGGGDDEGSTGGPPPAFFGGIIIIILIQNMYVEI